MSTAPPPAGAASRLVLRAKRLEMQAAHRLGERIALVDALRECIHALQHERGASSVYLASGGERFAQERLDAIAARGRRPVLVGGSGLYVRAALDALDIPPTNMSFHLKTLTHAGLVSAEQEGRFQRYRANMALMRELVAYLTEECCAGMPELCGVDTCADGLDC